MFIDNEIDKYLCIKKYLFNGFGERKKNTIAKQAMKIDFTIEIVRNCVEFLCLLFERAHQPTVCISITLE